MLDVKKARRKTFEVDVVEVTDDNIKEVAKWCGGDVRTYVKDGIESQYVKVRVYRPMNERQTMAFVGDRVLYAGTGYKVYLPNAFEACFDTLEAE